MWKKGDSGKRKKKVRDEGFSLRRSENGGYKDPHFQTLAGGGDGFKLSKFDVQGCH